MEPYNLTNIITQTTATKSIISRAIIQASAGKLVSLGEPTYYFWYSEKRLQWAVSIPTESYPRFFNSTDKAATFFVRSWIKGAPISDIA